jgi:hypothetical protein
MKYMLQIYSVPSMEQWAELTEPEQQAVTAEYMAISQEPGVVGGEQLEHPETASTVRVSDGETLITDGPFAETKDGLGGYYVVEADDLDAALAVAARIPAARLGGAVEVRPVVER